MPTIGRPNVERLWNRRNIKGLIKALEYQKDPKVREKASYVLGMLKNKQAVEPLIGALRDSNKDVCRTAAVALAGIGDDRAVEPLVASLKHSDADVRKTAAAALDKFNWKPDKDETRAAYWAAKQMWYKFETTGPCAVEPLLVLLKDGNSGIRKAAAQKLGEMKDIRAVEPLIGALNDDNDNVRNEAARALGKLDDSRAIAPLISVLKNPLMHSERYIAADALRSLKKNHTVSAPVVDEALEKWQERLNDWNKSQAIIESTRSSYELWSECLDDPS